MGYGHPPTPPPNHSQLLAGLQGPSCVTSPLPVLTEDFPSAGIGRTPLPTLQVGLEWTSLGVH